MRLKYVIILFLADIKQVHREAEIAEEQAARRSEFVFVIITEKWGRK